MREIERYSKLAEITKWINSKLDLRESLEQVVMAISEEIVQCNAVGIYLSQSDGTFRGYIGKPNVINGLTLDQLIVDPQTDFLARELIEHRKSIYIPDTTLDNRPDPRLIKMFKIKSLLGLPIAYEEKLYGLVFLFIYNVPMHLTNTEIQTVEAYVNMAAVAIRNANLFSRKQALLAEKQLLLDATRELSLCLTIKDVLNICFHYVGKVLDNMNIGAHLLENTLGGKFAPSKLSENSDLTEETWKRVHSETKVDFENDLVFAQVRQTKQPLFIPDVDLDYRPNKTACKNFGIKGLFIIPLVAMGEVMGTVAVVSLGVVRTYQESQMQLAKSIVDATATALSNITLREKLEVKVNNSEEKFSKAFNASPHMMSIIRRADCRYIDVNQRFLINRGFSYQDVIGKTPTDIGLLESELQTILDMMDRNEIIENREVPMTTKDGLKGTILLSVHKITLNNEECLLFASNDISEIKRMQAEMAQLDRLNLVGQMAAGIGHEIRNPMTTVKGYLQLLGTKPVNVEQKPTFDLLISELDRANSIITQFLSLAKTTQSEFQNQNLNDIINNMYPLIEANAFTQNKQVQFIPGLIPNLPLNEKEINQLILNLCRNGLEAMEDKCCLTIQTYSKDNDVVLTVEDEGCGIPEEYLQKVGTPFFTTKESGTGLGLAICYRIAHNHNASIDVRSSPRGTTFFVRFTRLNEYVRQSNLASK